MMKNLKTVIIYACRKMCIVGTKVLQRERRSFLFGDLSGQISRKKGILEFTLTFRVNIYTDKHRKY